MPKLLVAIALAAMAGTAQAIEMDNPFWVMSDIHNGADPPGRFVHPFKGKLFAKKMAHLNGLEGYSLLGTIEGTPACYIYYVNERARQHELAHCNGWPKDHRRTGLDSFHWTNPPPRQ
jgi:hypothetical protein